MPIAVAQRLLSVRVTMCDTLYCTLRRPSPTFPAVNFDSVKSQINTAPKFPAAKRCWVTFLVATKKVSHFFL